MQPNTITLDVNHDNDDGTTAEVSHVLTRYDEYQNRTEYIDEDHTLALRNKVGFYRTFPKVSGNYKGTAKSAVKFTQDVAVEGVDSTTTVTAPGIIDIGFSFPIGMTPAQTLELRMRAVAMLLDDAIMAPLCDQLIV
jgi:hypothetical protein